MSRSVTLTLRQALEPWHVLGEEGRRRRHRALRGLVARAPAGAGPRPAGVGPADPLDPRIVVTCNGRAVPLHPTGTNGEAVAGVRYRAWQPPSCLHPTIPVHAPLTFDIVDTWMGRSLGGCQYHVSHPGGLSYETFPVNSYEAESRRLSRFSRLALHARPGDGVSRRCAAASFPYTLDLRTA